MPFTKDELYLISLIDFCHEMTGSSGWRDVVCLDFRKVFDMFSHSVIRTKLMRYRLLERVMGWVGYGLDLRAQMWPSESQSWTRNQLPLHALQRLVLGPAEGLPGLSGDGAWDIWGEAGESASVQLFWRDSFGGILLQSTAKLSRVCREDGARLSTGIHSGRRMRGNKAERWEFKIRIMEKNELLWERSDTGTGSPERWDCHPWRHSKLVWGMTWATSFSSNYFEQDVGLEDLQRFLQTYMTHWFSYILQIILRH